MLSVLDWPDQFYNRFALSPDEASVINCNLGSCTGAAEPELSVTRLPDWASKTTMPMNGIGPEII